MPYIGDPPGDTMGDRIEERIRDLLLASPELSEIKGFYRGEPGFIPVSLHPFSVVFLSEEAQATGQEGYEDATGLRYFRYDGYVSVEVLHRDVDDLMPDSNRRADVGSYLKAKELTQASFNAVMTWGGPSGQLEDDPVVSFDTKEKTTELRSDTILNGQARRGDNVTNRGVFNFHLFTTRQNW
jgi:hypothetical protein